MPKIITHGDKFEPQSFKGWYGKCRCDCRFYLEEGDIPFFSQQLCQVNGKRERIIMASIPCPEKNCHCRASVYPFGPAHDENADEW